MKKENYTRPMTDISHLKACGPLMASGKYDGSVDGGGSSDDKIDNGGEGDPDDIDAKKGNDSYWDLWED